MVEWQAFIKLHGKKVIDCFNPGITRHVVKCRKQQSKQNEQIQQVIKR